MHLILAYMHMQNWFYRKDKGYIMQIQTGLEKI